MRALLPLLLLLGGCGCASVPSHDELRATALRLEFKGSMCSGTAISADTLVTAKHCVDRTLVSIDGTPVVAVGLGRDKRDMATIRVKGIKFKTWARFGRGVEQGDRVRWWGNPNGVAMYREGYVMAVGNDAILIDAPSFSGDSGSGVFDSRGQLVGVWTGSAIWISPNGTHLQMGVVYPPEHY